MRRLVAAVLVLVALALPTRAVANPGPYHWPGTGERQIVLSDQLASVWDTPLAQAMNAWNVSPYVELSIGRDVRCYHFRGMVELCPEYAPDATWIGLAGVFHVDEHITYGSVEINTGKSWGPAKRRYVLCHELGHVLGLLHRPTTASTSCMVPRFSQAAAPYGPDAQDLSDLAGMYDHDDASSPPA